MAEISKCKGTDCPLKETCYRYTAEEDPYRQRYFIEIPYRRGKCEKYWKTNGKKNNIQH